MKKLLLILMLFFISITPTFAAGEKTCDPKPDNAIEVKVTEYIPGACCEGDSTKGYTCHVGKGFSTVVTMMGAIIKYFTFLAGLAGVLFIIINGIMYSMGGMDDAMKTGAKTRIVQTLVGLIVLFMSGLILNMVAPWIYV